METYVYKQVGDLKIQADVYRTPAPVGPVVVWIHGGALIVGHRGSVIEALRDRFLDAGCVLVSIDYRLAPETKLPEVIEDVEDAFIWIRQRGSELFGADPGRLAVLGGSAGGYLTLVAGHRVQLPPLALVSFYGYGDLTGAWYSQPSPHPRHQQKTMSHQEAYAQVSGAPIADSRERPGDGNAFYQHLRQTGQWPQAVSGFNPDTEAERFTPFMPVRNVGPDYPPTLLIHGTADTDVPYEQSVLMAEQFDHHDIEHRLVSLDGIEHGLDGLDEAVKSEVYADAVDFVCHKLGI